MNEFIEILKEKDKEKRREMVTNRINKLDEESQDITINTSTIHHGFISSNSKVEFTNWLLDFDDFLMQASYTINNKDYLYEIVDLFSNNNCADINYIIRKMPHFLKHYFGVNQKGNNTKDRENVFAEFEIKLKEIKKENEEEFQKKLHQWLDIGTFKNNSMAECSEYAVLTQNIFSFMGIDTYYISGNFSDEKKQEGHSYNIIRLPNERIFIIDNTNPKVLLDKNDNIISYDQRVLEITEEELNSILAGEEFIHSFTVSNARLNNNNEVTKIDEQTWTYGVNKKRKVK